VFDNADETRKAEVPIPSKESLRASGQVQSLSRALKLLNALSYYAQGLSLSEVASEVGLPNSTAHRLLTTLQNERYVRFDSERSVWLIGVQAFRVGSTFVRSRDLVSIARPYMRRLMNQCGETVNLGILDRGEIIYLAQVETQKMMRAIAGPGGRAPVHCSGIGKALLAHLSPEQADQIMAGITWQVETANTISSEEAMRRHLPSILSTGYAIDDEENAVGLRCVASAIFDEHEEPIAAISAFGPATRLTDPRVPALGALVAAISDEITCEIGGRRPS
jgi:IclR family acetate operon transcriptional repressor